MPHIEATDGTRLYYYDGGGTGPVAVFVHAWSLSSTMWEYQVAAFREAGYRCIALDRRGHGRSDVPGTGYDLDTLAGDLAGLLDQLDLRRVVFVAHSLGTLELTRYLTRYGTGRVDRAAYVGAMTPGRVTPERLEAIAAGLRADRPKWFHDGAPAYFATSSTGAWLSPALVDDAVRSILLTPLEVQSATLQAMGTDMQAELRSIDIPALVVHGDADASAPIDFTGRPTAALLPNSRLEVYLGAPHGLYVTEKDRLNKELLAFAAAQ
ncbi:MAG TPA: alpha/beta hydrolase [Pseudonocardia sp.]